MHFSLLYILYKLEVAVAEAGLMSFSFSAVGEREKAHAGIKPVKKLDK